MYYLYTKFVNKSMIRMICMYDLYACLCDIVVCVSAFIHTQFLHVSYVCAICMCDL
jgi:hypothetical protein